MADMSIEAEAADLLIAGATAEQIDEMESYLAQLFLLRAMIILPKLLVPKLKKLQLKWVIFLGKIYTMFFLLYYFLLKNFDEFL